MIFFTTCEDKEWDFVGPKLPRKLLFVPVSSVLFIKRGPTIEPWLPPSDINFVLVAINLRKTVQITSQQPLIWPWWKNSRWVWWVVLGVKTVMWCRVKTRHIWSMLAAVEFFQIEFKNNVLYIWVRQNTDKRNALYYVSIVSRFVVKNNQIQDEAPILIWCAL